MVCLGPFAFWSFAFLSKKNAIYSNSGFVSEKQKKNLDLNVNRIGLR